MAEKAAPERRKKQSTPGLNLVSAVLGLFAVMEAIELYSSRLTPEEVRIATEQAQIFAGLTTTVDNLVSLSAAAITAEAAQNEVIRQVAEQVAVMSERHNGSFSAINYRIGRLEDRNNGR